MDSPRKRKRKEATLAEKSIPYFHPPVESIEDGKTVMRYKCKLCASSINGTNPSNLGSHLERKHPSIYASFTNRKEALQIKRLKILQNAVEIVSVNGRSFEHLLDSGYQKGTS